MGAEPWEGSLSPGTVASCSETAGGPRTWDVAGGGPRSRGGPGCGPKSAPGTATSTAGVPYPAPTPGQRGQPLLSDGAGGAVMAPLFSTETGEGRVIFPACNSPRSKGCSVRA